MAYLDQNSALIALDEALVPSPTLIDGRTETDRLWFLTEYARLLNFYDSSNTVNGTWEPFLLKDPVFLLTWISKTNSSKFQAPFQEAVQSLTNCFNPDIKTGVTVPLTMTNEEIADCYNRLFHQLTHVFMRMEHWTRFMQLSTEEYDLKSYLLHQIKINFAPYFWAILDFRDYLWMSGAIPYIERVQSYLFTSYDPIIWKQNKGKNPFWEVLGMTASLSTANSDWQMNPIEDLLKKNEAQAIKNLCLTTLKNTGDVVFNFFNTIIHNAPIELEKQQFKKSSYPDTTLLRAFVKILQIQQKQLNTISKKHLEFYYKDILKQKELQATPDSVFLYCTLAKQDANFELPANTLFNAGLDAQKQPILFANEEPVSLNPAQLAAAYTLTAISQGTSTEASLYLQTISTPGVLKTDENGKTESWATFGNNTPAPTALVKTGMAFASPLLLLREGERSIFIEVTFNTQANQDILGTAQFYLSTQKSWLPVTVQVQTIPIQANGLIPILSERYLLTISLDSSQPAIQPFLQNPDGISSLWPMLKIEFPNQLTSEDLQPLLITALKIKTRVMSVKSLNLYNDFGELSPKNPYPPFGPLPLQNSNFVIGSNEIFSKPLDSLYLTLNWDTLPANFLNYYQQYNNYITANPNSSQTSAAPPANEVIPDATTVSPIPVNVTPLPKMSWLKKVVQFILKFFKSAVRKIAKVFKSIVNAIWKFIKGIFQLLIKILTSILKPILKLVTKTLSIVIPNPNSTEPFNNTAFTVNFFLLQQTNWLPFIWWNVININDVENTITCAPYFSNSNCIITPVTGNLLFTTNSSCVITTQTCLAYNPNFGILETPASPATTPPQGIMANPRKADASIQTSDLKYTDASTSGFMKMSILGPSEGFGSSLFANVVSWVALNNATSLSSFWVKGPITQPPNAPFAPKLISLLADYEASYDYDLTVAQQDYPFQAFLYSPFGNFLMYDNSVPPNDYANEVSTNLCGESVAPFKYVKVKNKPTEMQVTGLPLFPELDYEGTLFLGFQNLIVPSELNLYFEMATGYNSTATVTKPDYYYLSDKGWKILDVLNDTTNDLNCSGIVTVNVPDDISASNSNMPTGSYWMAIAAKDNATTYSPTILLNPNGFVVKRSGTSFLNDTVAPVIKAGAIKQPQSAVPQIATTTQAFDSFGGKATENEMQMNKRVSIRIKTKDRALTEGDFFTLIKQNYPGIYYSNVQFIAPLNTITNAKLAPPSSGVMIPAQNQINVFVVKQINSWKDASAFVPLVSECDMLDIQNHLSKRVSVFVTTQVMNYSLAQLIVTATIIAKEGYESDGLKKDCIQSLNIYLSPWIKSAQKQITINQGVSVVAVTNFIASLEGVDTVSDVSFSCVTNGSIAPSVNEDVWLPSQNFLIVPSMNQNITVKLMNE